MGWRYEYEYVLDNDGKIVYDNDGTPVILSATLVKGGGGTTYPLVEREIEVKLETTIKGSKLIGKVIECKIIGIIQRVVEKVFSLIGKIGKSIEISSTTVGTKIHTASIETEFHAMTTVGRICESHLIGSINTKKIQEIDYVLSGDKQKTCKLQSSIRGRRNIKKLMIALLDL